MKKLMRRILILEDEERIRILYAKLLRSENFHVEQAKTPLEAIQVMENTPVDIMLLDIKIPGMDTASFFEFVKSNYGHIKIIVASVYSVDEQKTIIKDAADYYDKSHEIDILLDKIKGVENGQAVPEGITS